MTEDRCIACGAIVPEGRQICPGCEAPESIKDTDDRKAETIRMGLYRRRGGGKMPVAYICSPYAGDVKSNVLYAQELCKWILRKGYAPIAPHLYLPQILDDQEPAERALGLEAGLALLKGCDVIVVGRQYGISAGMAAEIREAARLCIQVIEV